MLMKRELISYDMTQEEEVKILLSFTDAQVQLFQTMLANSIFEKAGLKFNFEQPMAHVEYASHLDGRIQLLNLLLSGNEIRASAQTTQEV